MTAGWIDEMVLLMNSETGHAVRKRQVTAFVLLSVLGVLPFTETYNRAGGPVHLLHLAATALTVLALAFQLSSAIRRVAGRASLRAERTVRSSELCLHLAALGAGLVILDLGATWLAGSS